MRFDGHTGLEQLSLGGQGVQAAGATTSQSSPMARRRLKVMKGVRIVVHCEGDHER